MWLQARQTQHPDTTLDIPFMNFTSSRKNDFYSCPVRSRAARSQSGGLLLILASTICLAGSTSSQPLRNGGFEAAATAESWEIEAPDPKGLSFTLDNANVKEGSQALMVAADRLTAVTLRQEVFLPIGTMWRLTGWVKAEVANSTASAPAPRIGIEAQAGDQGLGQLPSKSDEWQQQTVVFRVPSPGRINVALNAFRNQAGKVWFDDIRLERVPETLEKQSVTIQSTRLSKHPIDLKQGGQFIELLCDLIPSMIAQQVESTSFEEEPQWNQAYKREIDKPYRPWYPDGAVHVAKYSFDTNNPFNGKRSQKIELPLANTWAGISQDGFYLESGHSYRLKLHMRSEGDIRVRASLHGDGVVIAPAVSLGGGSKEWRAAEVLLTAGRSAQNATLTIEFEGPGTLWLDRVYLIDTEAVLGLWRPDIVKALKAMNPGIVRFGGTTVEFLDWTELIGSWDARPPIPDEPWGGLQENFVGLEEFIQLAQFIGAEPMICLRWTGKTPEDAAQEVEYFNGGAETKWGALRAANGHREPYHIKYWQIGNEVSGTEYDASLKAFGEAMHRVDPSVKILSSFPSADTLHMAAGTLDYLCPHHYSVGDLNGTEDDLKRLQAEIDRDGQGKNVRVAITEWNTTGGEFGLTRGMLLTLGNALSLSRYQNLMHRYSDLVEIANRSNLVDSFGSGVIDSGPGWLYFTPAYYSQILYQKAAGSFSVKIDSDGSPSTYLQEPDLDAALSADGKILRIYAVNSTGAPRKVTFHLDPQLGSVSGSQDSVLKDLSLNSDSEAMNSRDQPNRVGIEVQQPHLRGSEFEWDFVPFSMTLLELNLAPTKHASPN